MDIKTVLSILAEFESIVSMSDIVCMTVKFDVDLYMIAIECNDGNLFEIQHYVGSGMGPCYMIYWVYQEPPLTHGCLATKLGQEPLDGSYRHMDHIPLENRWNVGHKWNRNYIPKTPDPPGYISSTG